MESKVSIIVPYYNDGKYIQETLDSVKKQTYRNWEIILVDDGSNEIFSRQVFDGIKEGEQLRKFREANAGPSAARNLAIAHALGKYILPLDADDLIAPTYIEKAVDALEKDHRLGIVYCKAELFGKRRGEWNLPEFTLKEMLCHNVIFVTAMFRREDWEKTGGYDINMKYGIEDYEFWLSILELGREVYRIPERLFFYRIKQYSRTTRFEKRQEYLLSSYDYIIRKHHELYRKHYAEVIAYLRRENSEIDAKYEHFKSLIPFYKVIRKMGKKEKRILKRLLHFK